MWIIEVVYVEHDLQMLERRKGVSKYVSNNGYLYYVIRINIINVKHCFLLYSLASFVCLSDMALHKMSTLRFDSTLISRPRRFSGLKLQEWTQSCNLLYHLRTVALVKFWVLGVSIQKYPSRFWSRHCKYFVALLAAIDIGSLRYDDNFVLSNVSFERGANSGLVFYFIESCFHAFWKRIWLLVLLHESLT